MKLFIGIVINLILSGMCFDNKLTGLSLAFGAIAMLLSFIMLLTYLDGGYPRNLKVEKEK